MKQQTLATAADQGSGYEQYRKLTRPDEFLKTMKAVMPWYGDQAGCGDSDVDQIACAGFSRNSTFIAALF